MSKAHIYMHTYTQSNRQSIVINMLSVWCAVECIYRVVDSHSIYLILQCSRAQTSGFSVHVLDTRMDRGAWIEAHLCTGKRNIMRCVYAHHKMQYVHIFVFTSICLELSIKKPSHGSFLTMCTMRTPLTHFPPLRVVFGIGRTTRRKPGESANTPQPSSSSRTRTSARVHKTKKCRACGACSPAGRPGRFSGGW